MLKIRSMTEAEFERIILKQSFEAYVKDIEVYKDEFIKHFKGSTPREFADNQFKKMLAAGVRSSNQTFWIVLKEDTDEEIGHLWYTALHDKNLCLLTDIFVVKKYRGQGFGTEILHNWENHVKESHPELKGLYLSVFNHNERAKNLYERYGFMKTRESFGTTDMVKEFRTN